MRPNIALLPLLGTLLAETSIAQAHDHAHGPDDLLHNAEMPSSAANLDSSALVAERVVLAPLHPHSRPSLSTSTATATSTARTTSGHLANPNAGPGPYEDLLLHDHERRSQDCGPHMEMRPVRPPASPRLHCPSQSTATTTGETAQVGRKRHVSTSPRSAAMDTPATTTNAVVDVRGSGISHDDISKTDSENKSAWGTATALSVPSSSRTARTHPRYLDKVPMEARRLRLEFRREVTIKLERAFEAFAASMGSSRAALAPTSSKARREGQAAATMGKVEMAREKVEKAREKAEQANLDLLQAEAGRLQSLYMIAAGSTSSEYFARPTFARPEPPRTRINSKR